MNKKLVVVYHPWNETVQYYGTMEFHYGLELTSAKMEAILKHWDTTTNKRSLAAQLGEQGVSESELEGLLRSMDTSVLDSTDKSLVCLKYDTQRYHIEIYVGCAKEDIRKDYPNSSVVLVNNCGASTVSVVLERLPD
jgi:hypothetical protein